MSGGRRCKMSSTYYVIVDLYNLTYQKAGNPAKLSEADKFKTLKDAEKELKDYDDDFNGAIYKVNEYTRIELEKVKG